MGRSEGREALLRVLRLQGQFSYRGRRDAEWCSESVNVPSDVLDELAVLLNQADVLPDVGDRFRCAREGGVVGECDVQGSKLKRGLVTGS